MVGNLIIKKESNLQKYFGYLGKEPKPIEYDWGPDVGKDVIK